ncbi:hypothetical protein [Algiphilus aromaticivorans]|uniref:hypothetical protein n=1 Tax=Algiphilus aromaticivorans TaxID=382454 RepID=UPI0005C1AB5F|nr:hypothetical protein [Algiphilus aromaticivorans]
MSGPTELAARLGAALQGGDFAGALALAQSNGEQLRSAHAEGRLAPEGMREWLDVYQGLMAHVASLREDTRTELARMQGSRRVARAYADA